MHQLTPRLEHTPLHSEGEERGRETEGERREREREGSNHGKRITYMFYRTHGFL